MRDKQIHRINAQFVKRALQRLLAFGPVESRINQQAFLPFYNVGVQLPQRVMPLENTIFPDTYQLEYRRFGLDTMETVPLEKAEYMAVRERHSLLRRPISSSCSGRISVSCSATASKPYHHQRNSMLSPARNGYRLRAVATAAAAQNHFTHLSIQTPLQYYKYHGYGDL
mgnify:CR=1 FL=1